MAQDAVDRYNASENCTLELFAPSYFVCDERGGRQYFRRVKLAYHYVFVRGRLDDVKNLCSRDNGFSFVLNRASEGRYAVVSEMEMMAFRIIARAYENAIPFFSLEDIDLEAGDVVEVVNGDFAGLKGTFIPRAKSKSGKIVLAIAMGNGTCAYDINVSDVRVLEFARNTTRAHDQIEAFVPQLLQALREFHRGEGLSRRSVAKIQVFVSRMQVVNFQSPKIDAKLQALLYASNILLGDTATAVRNHGNYERYKAAVTNKWTQSLIELIFALITNDSKRLEAGRKAVSELTANSKSQRMIAEEYDNYCR